MTAIASTGGTDRYLDRGDYIEQRIKRSEGDYTADEVRAQVDHEDWARLRAGLVSTAIAHGDGLMSGSFRRSEPALGMTALLADF